MEVLRIIAHQTVQRACGFGALAIFCVMVGMSFDLRIAFQAGGFLTTAMVAILIYKAWEAPRRPHRRTELWLYLPQEERPPSGQAQWAIATVMRETYFTYAQWSAAVAVGMWTMALVAAIVARF